MMVLLALAILPVSAHASVYDGDDLIVPRFSELVTDGGVVTEFTIGIQCHGVSSIRNLPDGWSATILPDGESYTVHVARDSAEKWLARLGIPDRSASNRQIESIRIGVISRGQWSDCIGLRASIRIENPDVGGSLVAREIRLIDVNVTKDDVVVDDKWGPDPISDRSP